MSNKNIDENINDEVLTETNEIKEKEPLFTKDGIKEMLKNTFVMLCIALIAGAVLGFGYEITKEPIARMEQNKIDEAHKTVFVDAVSFSESVLDKDKATDILSNAYPGDEIKDCIKALDKDGNVLGYVLEVVSHEGFGGDIAFSMGVTISGTINGISITSISETAGLGMKAPEVIVPQFNNVYANSFVVTKTGKTSDNEIDAISSATITSKAIVNGVNAGLAYFSECLSGGDDNE